MRVRLAWCRALLCVVVLLGTSKASAQEMTLAGDVTFNGLLQAWYLGGSGFDDTFKIRRAELKFTGGVSRHVRWTLMIDPAKALSLYGRTSPRPDENPNVSIIVQDVFVTLNYHRRLNVNAGQFKLPMSLEGLEPSGGLDTERALFSSDRARGGAYGDVRDFGVMAYGPLAGGFDYQFGFFTGSGDVPNDGPDDDSKAMAGRLVYRPSLVPGLHVGASRVWGGGPAAMGVRCDRLGLELKYVNGPMTLKTEYVTGTDGSHAREGYYTHLAYKLTPKWEAIARYDTWDPDTHLETTRSSVTERDYIAGFDYLVDGDRMKLQFNFVRKTFEDESARASNVGATRLQFSW